MESLGFRERYYRKKLDDDQSSSMGYDARNEDEDHWRRYVHIGDWMGSEAFFQGVMQGAEVVYEIARPQVLAQLGQELAKMHRHNQAYEFDSYNVVLLECTEMPPFRDDVLALFNALKSSAREHGYADKETCQQGGEQQHLGHHPEVSLLDEKNHEFTIFDAMSQVYMATQAFAAESKKEELRMVVRSQITSGVTYRLLLQVPRNQGGRLIQCIETRIGKLEED